MFCDQLFKDLCINYFPRYVGTVGEKSQLQGKKMIKDLTKKMFLLESSDGASSAGGSAVVFMVMMTMSSQQVEMIDKI